MKDIMLTDLGRGYAQTFNVNVLRQIADWSNAAVSALELAAEHHKKQADVDQEISSREDADQFRELAAALSSIIHSAEAPS